MRVSRSLVDALGWVRSLSIWAIQTRGCLGMGSVGLIGRANVLIAVGLLY
jgi:hypothetical protein